MSSPLFISFKLEVVLEALKIAKYILALSDPDDGDIISNLKLQKLLYYTQGFHLALADAAIFDEDIIHWRHGPVVENVYYEYKDFGSGALPVPTDIDFSDILSKDQKEIIDEVYNVYGQFSAWKLRQMTHQEPPWKNTSENEIIPHDDLKKYFKTQLKNG